MKLTCLGLLAALCLLSGPVHAQRKRMNIDTAWRFHFGHAGDPSKDFNYGITAIFSKSGKTEHTALDVKYKDQDWKLLDLPHDWVVDLPFVNHPSFDVMAHGYKPVGGLFPETSIGWYRKHLAIPVADSGQRFVLRFDGIFRNAQVWINGFYLGNNQSGYVGKNFEITDYINYHGDNVVVVRVDATQYEGWFYEGAGIYRHVWLERLPSLHIDADKLFVHAKVSGNNAEVTIETPVMNQEMATSSCTVTSYVYDRNGKKIASSLSSNDSVTWGEPGRIVQKIALPQPKLWSPEEPYLYRAVSVLAINGRTVDSVWVRFGVRTLAFDGEKGFFLNGKHVKIKGTNNHQDHAGVGSALPDYLQYYRIRLLKQLGTNAYRTSHNAPTPELLDACDSLGMLVLDEQRLLNSSPEYMDQFDRLLLRDRNHPSVFLWSIGNEEGWIQTNSTGKKNRANASCQAAPARSYTHEHICGGCGQCFSWCE
jgi:beta-galactosidase